MSEYDHWKTTEPGRFYTCRWHGDYKGKQGCPGCAKELAEEWRSANVDDIDEESLQAM